MSDLKLGFPGNEKNENFETPDNVAPPWDATTKFSVMGKPHPRLEAEDKVTGRAKYSYDIRFPDLIYAKMLRSPHASARVKSIDISKAKALPGVLYSEARQGLTVRYAGQGVAGIAAETEEILDDALALIEVEYEVLPCAVTVEDAMAPGAPQVLNGPNVGGRPGRGKERVDAVHKDADIVVEAEYRTQVQTHSCFETHGCVCKFDDDGSLTVWASTQSTFFTKTAIARAARVRPENVTVITEHMGGGFGSKFGADDWDRFCVLAARATKRPCRYLLDRRAEHLIAGNRPDSIQKCRFSANKNGTLMGAWVESWGTAGVGRGAGVQNPTIYRFRAAGSEQKDVRTHAGRGRAFRAPRHPQGVFALEGMIDEVAFALGMDPLALRQKNDAHPVRSAQWPVGQKAIGWRKTPRGNGAVKIGYGCAGSRWGHNARPGDAVRCRIGKDGSVLFANGSQDLGTGTRTLIAILGAEELGVPLSFVDVRLGHTTDPYGHASGGSVTAPSIAPVVKQAAWLAKRELLEHIAKKIGGDPKKMELTDGDVLGGKKKITFKQACALLPVDSIDVTGDSRNVFRVPRFSREVAGVQFARVAVDTETGLVKVQKIVSVQDCGQIVNELTVRSQMLGGVIQGLSYALFENRLLDRNTGDMVNADLLNYKIAGARDMPEIETIPFNVAQGGTTAGVSSLGEPATVPTAGAIANAVSHAIDARVRSLPITPDKVLAALGAL